MKKLFLTTVLSLFSVFCFSQNFYNNALLPASDFLQTASEVKSINFIDETAVFKLRPLTDSLLIAGGLGIMGMNHYFSFVKGINHQDWHAGDYGALASRDKIPTLDALLMHSYSKPVNYISLGTAAITAVAPAMFAFTEPKSQWLTIGVMYAEAMLIGFDIKDMAKNFVVRARPYMYYDIDKAPAKKLDNYEWEDSFFSGHTTGAFTAAAFTTYLFCQFNPDSKYKFAVAGATFGAAALTGVLRILSGNHFLSDVLCGAAIGTLTGFMVPYLHTAPFWPKSKNVDLSLIPGGIYISAKL